VRIKLFAFCRFVVVSLAASVGLYFLSYGGNLPSPKEASTLKLGICLGMGFLVALLYSSVIQLWWESKALKYYKVYLHTRVSVGKRDAYRRYSYYYHRLSGANRLIFHKKISLRLF
jgi:hypothetical protein